MTAVLPKSAQPFLECVLCENHCEKPIKYEKKMFCTVQCYWLYMTAFSIPKIEKICCICHSFFKGDDIYKVTRGDICSRKCFHLWLDDSMAKYTACVMEKILFEVKSTAKK